jgi:hypothetical protein
MFMQEAEICPMHAAWAVYKEQTFLWALVLYVSQTVWAALRTGQRVVEHVSD